MTANGILQIVLFGVLTLAAVRPLGGFMARVFAGERTWLTPVLGPVERAIYRVSGVDPAKEQHWTTYTVAMLLFNLVGCVVLYALMRLQQFLPLNPQQLAPVPPDLAFNTAVSFTTNTNWQNYGGESTMSYLVQMAGLAFHNFVSAATGIALAIALVRGFARHTAKTVGNFWADLVRCTLYVLLPLSLVIALVLVWQGVPQNLQPYVSATTVEGATQTIPQGPVASQEAIKQLGTNGGGFFNANSAHPYENPTPLSNLIAMLAIFLIGAPLTNTFGRMVKDERQGWALLGAMAFLCFVGVSVTYWAEAGGNPLLHPLGVDSTAGVLQAGGNMEGKEVRFGIANTALFAVLTTDASCGAVNGMHSSFTPLGGLVPLVNIMLGEVIVGGVGAGLYGMLLFAILAVFIAGLMVGRTPEYLGKKIEAKEVKMTMFAVLAMGISILGFTGLASVHPEGLKGPLNSGPHGFTEMLYAFTSATGNNGSAFAGLTGNTFFYNLTLGLAMLVGRFLFIVPALAVAGSLAPKKIVPASAGTFPTTSLLFVGLLVGVILIVGGLTYFPALSLGPIVEHFMMRAGRIFYEDPMMDDAAVVIPLRSPDVSLPTPPLGSPSHAPVPRSLFDREIMGRAIGDSFRKLDPRTLMRNPVMFVVEVVAAVTTIFFVRDLVVGGGNPAFVGQISAWLWFTVLFANFAEAVAEGRGKAQADTLRRTRTQTTARRLRNHDRRSYEEVPATALRRGNIVLVQAGDTIPGDGDVVEGIASVDESAITGESAPVIRESGGDRSAVTGGTRVLSDWIVVQITSNPGETFLDRMIALVEGAERQKTPNEIALSILLTGMTILFLIATVTIAMFANYASMTVSVTILIALLVTLIPTTIGGLLSAIGIAGMDRLVKHNVLAMSGRAVEAAGDVDTLLLDKTGTITLGNRMASEFIPVGGTGQDELADAAQLASLSDETPEGRSIVVLAKERYGLRGREVGALEGQFIPFTAQTRMSGVDLDGSSIRKGAADAVQAFVAQRNGHRTPPADLAPAVERIAKSGGTPLVVAKNERVLGVIHLKDVVKGGIRERFAEMRRMGIRTVMITGDNPLTAAAIAAEAGVDDFLAQATPENKLALIREEQAKGKLVAMCGDGTNDAPALAQADVGVAMNTGTSAAKEAGNMVDLDSNPTKLLEIVEIGKQLLITRGSLTTFSIANDVAKYFAIIPAMFVATYPELGALNVMRLSTPESAILSAVIFNALIIIALIPLALRGVTFRAIGAAGILRRNLLIYGVGGIIVPFIGIKAIDMLVSLVHLA